MNEEALLQPSPNLASKLLIVPSTFRLHVSWHLLVLLLVEYLLELVLI
jgi:hypothetical protein